MDRDTKKTSQEIARWLRIGMVTVTTLAPIINSIASQLRQRAEIARVEALRRSSAATADGQERLLAVSASLSDALDVLKEHPYSRELMRRGGDLGGVLTEQSGRLSRVLAEQGDTLRERGSKATQAIAERSGDVVSDLAERSSKATQLIAGRGSELVSDLAERGNQVSKDVTKRSEQLSKELTKRSKRASKELAKRSEKLSKEINKRSRAVAENVGQRNGTFWSVFGFSIGLSAALAGIYWLIRRRMREESLESQSFQLSQNGHLNGVVRQPTATPVAAVTSQPVTSAPQAVAQAIQGTDETLPAIAAVKPPVTTKPEAMESVAESATPSPTLQQAPVVAQPATSEESAQEEAAAPTQAEKPLDAKFLALASNKRYYPIEIPLDQLPRVEGEPLDVLYFATAEEAEAQGFSATE